jgi:hypothetical protein
MFAFPIIAKFQTNKSVAKINYVIYIRIFILNATFHLYALYHVLHAWLY